MGTNSNTTTLFVNVKFIQNIKDFREGVFCYQSGRCFDRAVREGIQQMIEKIDRRIIKKKMEAFNNDRGQDGRKKEQEIIHKSIEREVQV